MSKREVDTIRLSLDNGEEIKCAVLFFFKIEDQEYIALLPQGDNPNYPDDEVLIYRFEESEEGDPILSNIESDEEYEAVAEEYSKTAAANEAEEDDYEEADLEEESDSVE